LKDESESDENQKEYPIHEKPLIRSNERLLIQDAEKPPIQLKDHPKSRKTYFEARFESDEKDHPYPLKDRPVR